MLTFSTPQPFGTMAPSSSLPHRGIRRPCIMELMTPKLLCNYPRGREAFHTDCGAPVWCSGAAVGTEHLRGARCIARVQIGDLGYSPMSLLRFQGDQTPPSRIRSA